MKKEYPVYVQDILDCINRIEEYVKDLNENDFCKDYLVQDAVLRRLEIIGEAVKNIPERVKDNYPKIPWRKIAGLRDVLIHAYSGVNLRRVWKIITDDLPELKRQIADIMHSSNTGQI